jgi:hypothetical protein
MLQRPSAERNVEAGTRLLRLTKNDTDYGAAPVLPAMLLIIKLKGGCPRKASSFKIIQFLFSRSKYNPTDQGMH